jgi:hypothetical protein
MVFENEKAPHYITSEKMSLNLFIYHPIAIIFFLTLKEVFKRGQELKQENDLTV